MKKSILLLLSLISFSVFAQTKSDSLHITLQQAIEIALNESPTMRIADRTIETKKYYKKEQIVGLFPNVTAGTSYQRTLQKQKMMMDLSKMTSGMADILTPIYEFLVPMGFKPPSAGSDGPPEPMSMGSFNNMGVSANLSLPIIMPALWNTIKLTSLDIELATEQARSSKIALINNVKKAYYRVLIAQEVYKIYTENYKNIVDKAKLVNDKFEQGLVSEFEKLRADVQVSNAKPNITNAANALDLSQKALKICMGVDIYEPLIFSGELKEFETEMKNSKLPDMKNLSLEHNSDLKQMDMSIQQLERSRKIVLSGACPALVLNGSFQYMTMGDDIPVKDFKWFPTSLVGVSLQIPIISWASTTYKTKQIQYNIQNLNDTRLNVERGLWLSINNNLGNIDKAIADFESNSESVKMATRAYSIVQKQYEVGLATWHDLSDAEFALLMSQLSYYQSIHDYLSAQAELEYVLGKER
ncbi:MAG: TolC family protein [Bacteroidetes bacterium]|nr:TolC family protein [Bacteroidota bacterium]